MGTEERAYGGIFPLLWWVYECEKSFESTIELFLSFLNLPSVYSASSERYN
jgi:hypothetical protein